MASDSVYPSAGTAVQPPPQSCPHGMSPALPCASCGRGYPTQPTQPMVVNVRISLPDDEDVDRIVRRVVEILKGARDGAG